MSKAFSGQKGRTQPYFDPFKPFHCIFICFSLKFPINFRKLKIIA